MTRLNFFLFSDKNLLVNNIIDDIIKPNMWWGLINCCHMRPPCIQILKMKKQVGVVLELQSWVASSIISRKSNRNSHVRICLTCLQERLTNWIQVLEFWKNLWIPRFHSGCSVYLLSFTSSLNYTHDNRNKVCSGLYK